MSTLKFAVITVSTSVWVLSSCTLNAVGMMKLTVPGNQGKRETALYQKQHMTEDNLLSSFFNHSDICASIWSLQLWLQWIVIIVYLVFYVPSGCCYTGKVLILNRLNAKYPVLQKPSSRKIWDRTVTVVLCKANHRHSQEMVLACCNLSSSSYSS